MLCSPLGARYEEDNRPIIRSGETVVQVDAI